MWLSELGKVEEKHLESPGLTADSATLDVTRSKVAFTARRSKELGERLFLMDLGTGLVDEVPTGLMGPHHAPAFSGDGKRLFFTAAAGGSPGPEQPTRIRAWNLGTAKLEPLPTTDDSSAVCEFHPAPRKSDVLHVSTDCLGRFTLDAASLTGPQSTTAWKPRKLSSPEIEIAASFDGSRFVYTSVGPAGLSLLLQKGDAQPKVVAVLPSKTTSVQPRFVCPRDVMFLREGRAIVLNTDTEEMLEASMVNSKKSNAKGKR